MKTTKKPLICGIGINDADYQTHKTINRRLEICPFYAKWSGMINRCYNSNSLKKRSPYSKCSVSKDWLTFSNFKAWMEKQDWRGLDLDKDILVQGNKVYSAETCLFVPQHINSLFCTAKAARGNYPIGVSPTGLKKFKASCSHDGKVIHLGTFDAEAEAHRAYLKFKYNLIEKEALNQTEPLRSAMLDYIIDK